MAAIEVKTGVYLPSYSLQNAYSIGSNPETSGWEAALQKPLECPLGHVGTRLTKDCASTENWLNAIINSD
ncbi:MAG: hypothetical protein F6K28_17080 [Microcoleus sp. SIO2G3]|nr:hypothetical protein [Microcoleus sp. SIO2G3]